ncbi:YceI family protein [Dokdonella sp.]|uniref:YceI family protein n=1 Tax=Dokdonella sp. TaxID=2291710 RepID=UPI00352709A9
MTTSIRSGFTLALSGLLAFSQAVQGGQPETWTFDPVHTQVIFFADHLGFSKAIGRLKLQQGWFQFDPDDWSNAQADVVIDIGSLDMGEPAWTRKVLSPAFLDAEQWPTARFISTSLEQTGKDAGVLHGDLWLRGVKQPVDLEVTFNRIGGDPYAFKTKAGFSARTTLDRFAFGMDRYRDVVAGPVELRIEVEGVRSRSKKGVSDDATEGK